MSGGKCRWFWLNIRWGAISSKYGINYVCWVIWGNWGWVFLERMGLSNRSGHLGLDWDGFYSPAVLWYACWGSFQRRHFILSVCSILLREIGLLCNGWYNAINWRTTGWMVQMDWTDRMGWGWDEGSGVSRRRIRSVTIGSWGVVGSGKQWQPPI